MNLFDNLFGGQQRQEYEDFVNRYQQGHPSEGYSEEEVMQRYQKVASNVPEDVYQQGGSFCPSITPGAQGIFPIPTAEGTAATGCPRLRRL
jgi:hypothetical protein